MIRVGIIGVGNVARTHIAAYSAWPQQCEIVGLSDVSPERARDVAREVGLTVPVYESYGELLRYEKPELVSICTPPSAHAVTTVDCLRAGVNVLVEKPMALSLEECDAMLAAAESSGKTLAVVAQNRFRNDIARLKAVIDSGTIGALTHVRINSSWWRGAAYYDLAWRGTWASEGGGSTLSQAIHHLDLALWLAGPPAAVTAVLANAAHDNSEVEDLSVAILQVGRGLVEIATSVVDHGEEQSITVYGERARIAQPWSVVASRAQPNGFPAPGGDPETVARVEAVAAACPVLPYEGHTAQIGELLAAVEAGRPPAVTGTDGRAAIELVTAIYESGIEHCTVPLPLTPADPYYHTGELARRAPHFHTKETAVDYLPGPITIGSSAEPQ